MNLNKRPIADMAIYFGKPLYRVVSTPFSKDDPAFSGMLQDKFEYFAIENGTVETIKRSEDREGLSVGLLMVDNKGNVREELPAEEALVNITLPFKQEEVTFKAGVWCDELSRAKELCNEKNREAKARLEEVANKVMDKVSFIDNLMDIEG